MNELTLFTIPKAWKGHAAIVQTNALESWIRLEPRPTISLFGRREPGVPGIAKKYGCELRSVHRDPKYGIPLINSAFARAQKGATTRLMWYTNSDMIYLDDIMPAITAVAERFDDFLIVGQKTDIRITKPLRFNAGWQDRLRELARRKGVLHKPYGIDFFIFTKGLYGKVPPFAIAKRTWDNWLLEHILKRGVPVVDVTPSVLAVHQMNLTRKSSRHPLIAHNRKLGGKAGRGGRINYAPWELTSKGVRRRR